MGQQSDLNHFIAFFVRFPYLPPDLELRRPSPGGDVAFLEHGKHSGLQRKGPVLFVPVPASQKFFLFFVRQMIRPEVDAVMTVMA